MENILIEEFQKLPHLNYKHQIVDYKTEESFAPTIHRNLYGWNVDWLDDCGMILFGYTADTLEEAIEIAIKKYKTEIND